MATLKSSLAGVITLKLSSLLSILGLEMMAGDTNVEIFRRHSFVYSSVPAFSEQVYIFGRPVDEMCAYYPNVISQTVFVTYRDSLTICLSSDVSTVAHPEELVSLFAAEVADWAAQLSR